MSHRQHDLYYAAVAADEAFSAELVRQFGAGRAGNMRYVADESVYDERTRDACAAKKRADAERRGEATSRNPRTCG